MSASLNAQNRARLRQFMVDRFDMAELAEICFDRDLKVEEFPHGTLSELVQALITFHERQGELACLLAEILKRRPDESMRGLLAAVGGCDPRTKIQLILANDLSVTPDVKAKLEEIQAQLAQLLRLNREQVAIMGMVTGSTWLLVGLPRSAAARLLALNPPSLVNGTYQVVSILPYDTLPLDQQLEWRRRVLSGQARPGPGRVGSPALPPTTPPAPPSPGSSPAGGDGGGRGCLGWLTVLVIGLTVGGGLLWTVLTRPGAGPDPTAPPATATVRPTNEPPTRTAPPAPPTPTPLGFIGTWKGQTEQGESISFQVAPDAVGQGAFNLSVTFRFDAPCPIGKVTFNSLGTAHIFEGPSSSVSFPPMTTSNATGFVQGAFSSNSSVRGTLQVTDTRSPSERLNRQCPFSTTINWEATKQ